MFVMSFLGLGSHSQTTISSKLWGKSNCENEIMPQGWSLALVLNKARNLFLLQHIASQRCHFWRCAFSISQPIRWFPRGCLNVSLSQQDFLQTSVSMTGQDSLAIKLYIYRQDLPWESPLRFSCDMDNINKLLSLTP